MNHVSLKSAERWEKLGLFQDSEFVYCADKSIPILRSTAEWVAQEFEPVVVYEIIGPAPHCEELMAYIFNSGQPLFKIEKHRIYDPLEVFVWYQFPTGYHWYQKSREIKAKNETEAREKAINWHLDQKEK